MDYKKIYEQMIFNARNRILDGYVEKHHIIPKCMGGKDINDNIVQLTAKEHYIVHRLLIKIYPDNEKLIYAFWMMSNRFQKSSNDYSKIKSIVARNMRKNVGTKKAILKMAKSKKGQQSWLNKTHTKESKIKMSISAKNRKKQPNKIKIYQYDLNDNFIKEWESLSEAAKFYEISTSGITTCAKGKQKTAAKFKWYYNKL